MPAQVAVRSMRQRKAGLLGKAPRSSKAERRAGSSSPGTNVQEADRERGARTLAAQLHWGCEKNGWSIETEIPEKAESRRVGKPGQCVTDRSNYA